MRKTSLILAVALLTLMLAACSRGEAETKRSTTQETTTEPTDTAKPTPDESEEPLLDRMQEDANPDIQLNQVGYRPDDEKVAVFAGFSGDFHVVDAKSLELVFSAAAATDPIEDAASGNTVHTADFSAFAQTGSFFILAEEAGRSYPFIIAERPYQELKNAVLKMLYYQRCGMPLEEAYAGDFDHAGCHEEDAFFHSDPQVHVDTTGGWHDAGDYGKYTVPTAKTIADLLWAYELFPQAFAESHEIPESDNERPDILDEARYGIDWMFKMQNPVNGGVHHKVSTNSFPSIIPPDADRSSRYLTSISPTATADFAAVMAMSARIFQEKDPDYAQAAHVAAQQAWDWLSENPNAAQYQNPQGMTTGEYADQSHLDEWLWAAAELYRFTGEDEYHDFLRQHQEDTSIDWHGFGWQNMGGYATVAYLFTDEGWLDESMQALFATRLLNEAQRLTEQTAQQGYHHSLGPDDFYWGSNMLALNRSMLLIFAHILNGEDAFEQSAQDHLHYLLGRNPLSKSFVSGFGSDPLRQPHHRPTWALAHLDPFPGLIAGGPNRYLQDATVESMLPSDVPPAKAYIDHPGSYSTNEVTIYWNSPAVFVSGYFDR